MKKGEVAAVVALWIAILCSFAAMANADPTAGKAIELILDCSGSMNAVLPDGTTRMEAARQAVSKVVNSLPSDIQVAFRAYGHQSAREKGDCNDTALLVPFDSLGKNKQNIITHSTRLQALGYTPITKSLQVAVADFQSSVAGEKMIILVSDGKETCSGDPCATARAIQNAGVKLVIHTVGFAVDDATRSQLKCIAETTGGSYFDAANADQLEKVINQAAESEVEKIVIVKETNSTGKLMVKGADVLGHTVMDAETGKEVGTVNVAINLIELPTGLYNVTFGASLWKSVRITTGQTTVLEPARLTITNGWVHPTHKVTDSETGVLHGEISLVNNSLTLMPGLYDVSFGEKLAWRNVSLNSGSTTTLNPGRIKVMNPAPTGHSVYSSDGKEVGQITLGVNYMPLLTGDYFITIDGQKIPFKIVEGKEVLLELKQN